MSCALAPFLSQGIGLVLIEAKVMAAIALFSTSCRTVVVQAPFFQMQLGQLQPVGQVNLVLRKNTGVFLETPRGQPISCAGSRWAAFGP